jgi:hypothetical protein
VSHNRIRARDLAADVRSGLNDFDLIDKYSLSLRNLNAALRRLVEAGILREPEILERSGGIDSATEGHRTRQKPRAKIPFGLPVQDISAPHVNTVVRDLTEEGFRVAGIRTSVGEVRDFLILADVVESLSPILVQAKCLWTYRHRKRRKYRVAGFQITDISPSDLETLRKIVKVVALLDQGMAPSRLGLKTALVNRRRPP